MSHSKRNTSRPVFTSHERAVAKSNWATSSARLGRDSFLPFGSCGLCLGVARDPVACLRGDVFCYECALTNILAQKREIKRAERASRSAKRDAEHARAAEDDEDRKRAIRDFELTQAGVPASKRRSGPEVASGGEPSTDVVVHAGSKRKFTMDDDDVSRVMKEDKSRARRAIEEEKADKPTLPSFWTPSLTPDVQDSKLPPAASKDKTAPECPLSPDDDPHPISMQTLVTVHFHEDVEPSKKEKRRACPSCLKTLSNASSPVMTEQCGHVLCMSCAKMLAPPAGKSAPGSEVPATCFVCDTPLASNSSRKIGPAAALPPGLVVLRSEGTGFSARGSNTVAKSSTAFQC